MSFSRCESCGTTRILKRCKDNVTSTGYILCSDCIKNGVGKCNSCFRATFLAKIEGKCLCSCCITHILHNSQKSVEKFHTYLNDYRKMEPQKPDNGSYIVINSGCKSSNVQPVDKTQAIMDSLNWSIDHAKWRGSIARKEERVLMGEKHILVIGGILHKLNSRNRINGGYSR